MRERAVREIGTIVGVVVILAVIVLVNGFMKRGSLAEIKEKERLASEEKQRKAGQDLISWDLLRKTKGTKWTGPTFVKDLLDHRDKDAGIIGFMVPEYEFRGIKNFLLLPVPIECYFCAAPPMRDVVMVEMAEGKTTDLYREPVLIRGKLALNEGKGTKFFYVVKNAECVSAEKGRRLTPRSVDPATIQHAGDMRRQEAGAADPNANLEAPLNLPDSPAPAQQ